MSKLTKRQESYWTLNLTFLLDSVLFKPKRVESLLQEELEIVHNLVILHMNTKMELYCNCLIWYIQERVIVLQLLDLNTSMLSVQDSIILLRLVRYSWSRQMNGESNQSLIEIDICLLLSLLMKDIFMSWEDMSLKLLILKD